MTIFCKTTIFLFVALLTCIPLALGQGTYTQIDLPGSSWTSCWGINTAGEISGSYADASGNVHGFILNGGVYTTVDYPGALATNLYGLNDQGEVVGTATLSTGSVGFDYSITYKYFNVVQYPGGGATTPLAINGYGYYYESVIAGYFVHGSLMDGFQLHSYQHYERIFPPDATSVTVSGVDDNGELLGTANSEKIGLFNFSYNQYGQPPYQQVLVPDAPGAVVEGINPAGSVLVGYYVPSAGAQAGFLYQHQTLQTLQFPASNSTAASSVNSSRTVVGTFYDTNNVKHGFTWTR